MRSAWCTSRMSQYQIRHHHHRREKCFSSTSWCHSLFSAVQANRILSVGSVHDASRLGLSYSAVWLEAVPAVPSDLQMAGPLAPIRHFFVAYPPLLAGPDKRMELCPANTRNIRAFLAGHSISACHDKLGMQDLPKLVMHPALRHYYRRRSG